MIAPRLSWLQRVALISAVVTLSTSAGAQESENKCYVFFKADVRKDATEQWPWTKMISPVLETSPVKLGGHVACPPMQTTSRADFVEVASKRGLEVMGGAIAVAEVSDLSADVVFEKHAEAVKAARSASKPPIIVSWMKGAVQQDCDAINAKLKAAGATILRPC